jgi:hypothetical protein
LKELVGRHPQNRETATAVLFLKGFEGFVLWSKATPGSYVNNENNLSSELGKAGDTAV